MTILNLFLSLIPVVLLENYTAANVTQGLHPETHHTFSNQHVTQLS